MVVMNWCYSILPWPELSLGQPASVVMCVCVENSCSLCLIWNRFCLTWHEKEEGWIMWLYISGGRGIRKNLGFGYPLTLCTIFTILLTHWNSEQENGLLIKKIVFCPIIMIKLGQIVAHMDNYNFTKFHQKLDEKQKTFY